jgi:predicted enzyme related to lactoylglutathione lyase
VTVKRIRQIFVAAADFEAQCKFFESTVGLDLQFRDGSNWAQFSAGDISFAIAGRDESMGAAVGTMVPVFEVEDLETHLERVTAGGGTHGEIRDMGDHGRTVLAKDPLDIPFALLQR